ncbi:malic enzyme-like NAD(P)-binding protein [uncultured Brachyspira sp.]|uniref:malic enzyme-like NAD(P)-binding protein n=1 Tax=uncultured Brachyspira sp. TaxID=221953 RepID=UPI002604E709|nr:malic enzyme-like NAD(P)-binding protein [uncultured Brachyspira sp.]
MFHDDQHGTAIICSAALINALEISNIDKKNAKIVFNGAGSAGISCAKMFVALGVPKENIIICYSKGVITKERIESVTEEKREFATDLKIKNLEEAMKGANVFAGLSVADCVSEDMVKSMAKNPIIFAMANHEIQYEKAIAVRDDLIMATGRSDYPNQINNVLGFLFIFSWALDVKAKAISEKMKMAAALAALTKEKVPEKVFRAYGNKTFEFGKNYIVPKPFDPRVIEWVSPAVAKAACDEWLARELINDFEKYKSSLKERMKKYWN